MPRLGGDAVEPRSHGRVRLELEPTLGRDMRIRVERDVRECDAVSDEELAAGDVALQPAFVSSSRRSSERPHGRPEYESQKRTTASDGSSSYCS